MIILVALTVLSVLALVVAVGSVVAHDGRSQSRPPASHYVDRDFVAPRDWLGV